MYLSRYFFLLLSLCTTLCFAQVRPTAAPAAGQKFFVRGNGSEPTSLDASRANGVPDYNILVDLYECLVNIDQKGEPIPAAAVSWTISPDGKVYTFKLQPKAKWSNGDPVTAADFVYGLRRGVDPKTASPYSFLAEPIVNAQEIYSGTEKNIEALGVKALDDYTLEIRLKKTVPYFVGMMEHPFFAPKHKASIDKFGDSFTKPGNLVSNGAFKLDKWVPQERIVLVKNPHYHDAANVKLDGVVYLPIESARDEFNRYQAGEVHMTYSSHMSTEILATIQADKEKNKENSVLAKEYRPTPYLANYYYSFNVTKPPFKDNAKLRKALFLAIDRKAITDKIVGTGEQPLFGYIPTGVANYWDYYKSPYENKPYSECVAEAKKLYEEAGYSADNPLNVEFRYNTDENHKKIAIAVAGMWKSALGVNTKLTNSEFKIFLADRQKREVTQVFRNAWVGDYNDPYTFFEILLKDSDLNNSGYNDPDYEKLVYKASETVDLKERSKILGQAEALLFDDSRPTSYPFIPFYNYVSKSMVKSAIEGYNPSIRGTVYSKNISFKS